MEHGWFYSGCLVMPEVMHKKAPSIFLHKIKLQKLKFDHDSVGATLNPTKTRAPYEVPTLVNQ